ncbi:MAG: PAS domain S-box protein, partial [Candidatus Zixiibacteriota bacterium]
MNKQPNNSPGFDWTGIPDVVAELDAEGRFVYISRVLPGINKADVIGSHVLDWIPEDSRERVAAALESVRRTGQPTTYEVSSHVGGETHWWVTRVGPILTNGDFTGFLLINIDVTRLREAQRELESKRRFVELINNATPNIMYVVDLKERKVVYLNQAGCDFGGFSEHEAIELGYEFIHQVLHPDDFARLEELWARWDHVRGNEILEADVRLRHHSGNWHWFLMRERAFARDEHGAVTQVIGIAHEATARIEMEQRLAESERKYRQIVELTHDGIAVIDAEGKTVFANPRMSEMLGYTEEELLGRTMFELVAEQSRDKVYEGFKRRQTGVTESYEVAFRCKNGSELWCLITATPIMDNDGHFAGVLGIMKDVT